MPVTEIPIPVRALLCFLLGSIPFAVLAMRGSGIDILRAGSRNPGFNNVLRYSKRRAMVTLAGDLGKGFLAIWLLYAPSEPIALGWLFGISAILGHCYSPWLKFNGGKGIATSAGVMLVLYPPWAAICLVVFAALRITGGKLKWVEAGTIASLSSWLLFTCLMLAFQTRTDTFHAGLTTLFLAWRHKSNFRILANARHVHAR
ncbi:MAG: glycerol-3-phosphate acyltransferase [Bryobacteraceae bacterium]